MDAPVGSHSDREFYLDATAAFVDFVIEAITASVLVAAPTQRLIQPCFRVVSSRRYRPCSSN
jgi:hypothetical protein